MVFPPCFACAALSTTWHFLTTQWPSCPPRCAYPRLSHATPCFSRVFVSWMSRVIPLLTATNPAFLNPTRTS
ncbi:hypothetical protein EDD17DRAFT_1878625 [Pisolithus thermaeus]|nr:hypothetical protein EDD17DRAFT_1878625 [Pisolithus thermaeus]